MNKIIKKSPAKINIGLNVLEKRKDGFHNIETIFYPLLLHDTITFQQAGATVIKSDSDEILKLKSNIILKTIDDLEQTTKKNLSVNVFIEKNIPIGAGLGGGSSNAAITLKALNEFYQLKLSNDNLIELALKIGSDVPFFLNPFPAFAESRGEKIKPISLEINYPVLLVNPGINISTKWAFENITPAKLETSLFDTFAKGEVDLNKMCDLIKNDFESLIFYEYPQIAEIKEDLYKHGAAFALMTGTGSTVYGVFSNLQRAYFAEDYFKQKEYFTFLNNPFMAGSIT